MDEPHPSPHAAGQEPATPERPRGPIKVEEIRMLLADEGYSAGERSSWLKSVLTDLQNEDTPVSEERQSLIDEIKAIIGDNQDGEPMSDDVI